MGPHWQLQQPTACCMHTTRHAVGQQVGVLHHPSYTRTNQMYTHNTLAQHGCGEGEGQSPLQVHHSWLFLLLSCSRSYQIATLYAAKTSQPYHAHMGCCHHCHSQQK